MSARPGITLRLLCLLCPLGLLPGPARAATTDNGDGTVTDSRGLMWLKEAPRDPTSKTWQDAMLWANALEFAGHDDWRLPSGLEFSTGVPDLTWDSRNNEWGHLYGIDWADPASAADIAPMTGYGGFYWTSTENPGDQTQAATFFVSFDGVWMVDFILQKTATAPYTAVRGLPKPTKAPQCRDGYDNDRNGLLDFPGDPGCSGIDDDSEYTCHGLWCLVGRRVDYPPWRICVHIDDSTICFNLIVPIVGIIVIAAGAWWLRKRRRARTGAVD